MRKALSVLLALSMLLSLCVVPSFAEEAIDEPALEEEILDEGEAIEDEDVVLMEGEEGEGEATEPESPYYDREAIIKSITAGNEMSSTYSVEKLIDDNPSTWWETENKFTGENFTEEGIKAKTINVMFKEKTSVGGIAITIRNGNFGGAPERVAITAIYDEGEELIYQGFVVETADYAWTLGEQLDIHFPEGTDTSMNGLRVTVLGVADDNGTGFSPGVGVTCIAELDFLKPDGTYKASEIAYAADECPVIIAAETEIKGDRATAPNFSQGTIRKVFDGRFDTRMEWANALVNDETNYPDSTADMTFVLLAPATFSGVRIYQRATTSGDTYIPWSNGNADQSILKANVYVSDDGKNWIKADLVSVSQADRKTSLAQDFYVSFNGVPYDISGKYIKISAIKGAQTTLSASEIRFLAPRENTVLDVAELAALKTDEDVLAVKADIEALADLDETPENIAVIEDAREAYDGLSDIQKLALSHLFGKNYLAELEAMEAKKSYFIYEAGDFAVPSGTSFTSTATSTLGVSWTGDIANLTDKNLATRSGIENAKFSEGNKAWIIADLSADTTFAGVRLYARRSSTNTSTFWESGKSQTFIMGKVYVSDDGKNWVPADTIGSETDEAELYIDVPTTFGGVETNITARYIKVYADYAKGGSHWAISELRLLKPDSGNETFAPSDVVYATEDALPFDITDKDTLEAKAITLSDDSANVESLVIDADTVNEKTLVNGTDYTLSENTIILATSHLKELLLGTHTYKVSFTNGLADYVDVTVADSTQILYNYVGVQGAGTTTVVLTNVAGTAATGAVANGTDLAVTNDANNTTITIGRSVFRKTGLYYNELAMADEGVYAVPVEVTFDGTTTVDYKVVIKAPWTTLPKTYSASGSATSTSTSDFSALNFADDEVAVPENSGWRIRTDSARSAETHPLVAFAMYGKDLVGDAANKGRVGWHTWHGDDNFDAPASPNNIRFIDLDLGENAPVIGGIRYYPRQNDAGTAIDNAWGKIVILAKNSDEEDWEELYNGNTVKEDDTGYKRKMEFAHAASYRYYRIKIVANHCNALKIRLLAPTTKVVGSYEFDKGFLDMRANLQVSYQAFPEGQLVTKVAIGDTVLGENDYEVTDDTVTIEKDALSALSVGEHTIKLTIGDVDYSAKLTVTDSSSAEFKFIHKNGSSLARTENLVLTNVLEKTVTSVKDKATGKAITFTADESNITITRTNYRKAFDAYASMGLNGGVNELSVTFEGGTVLTYTVNMTGEWFTTSDVVTSVSPNTKDTVADDEIAITQNFRVRTDSIWETSRKWAHPINAFYYEEVAEGVNGSRYHADTTEGMNHYIDVDLGESVTLGGIRYIARYDGDPSTLQAMWETIKIYGSNDFEHWEELYTGSATKVRVNDLYFTKSANVQYIRIYVVGTWPHANANALRLLKPVTKAINTEADFEVGDTTLPSFAFELTGEEEITAIAVKDGAALAADDYEIAKDGVTTITLSESYIETLDAGNSFLADLRQGKTYTYTVTIGDKTFDVTLNYVNSKVEKYLVTTVENSSAEGNTATNLGTGHLIVKNFHTDKEVSKIYASFDKSDFTDAAEVVDFNASNPALVSVGEEIKIGRSPLRRAIDLYSAIGGDMTGEAYVKVVYTDGTEVVYTLIVSSEWKSLAADITETAWADDEIPAQAGWKITTSSALNQNNHPWQAIAKDAVGVLHGQNWHTAHIGGTPEVSASAKKYLDIDFGTGTIEKYMGVRYLERKNSDNWNSVMILGSDDYETWTPLYYQMNGEVAGSVPVPVVNGTATEIPDTYNFMFNDGEVAYRYLRIIGWGDYLTADEIRILKAQSKVKNNSLTIYADPAASEDKAFYFTMAENLAGDVAVEVNGAPVDVANYEIDAATGTITFKEAYLKTIAGENTVTFTVAGAVSEATLIVKDRYSLTYLMAGTPDSNDTTRGDNDVVLSINPDLFGSLANVETNAETGVKTVTVVNTKSERDDKKTLTATLDEEAKTLTIARKDFRKSGDLYRDGAVLEVTFEDGVKKYTVNTTATWNALGTVKQNDSITAETEKWKDDEIVAKPTWEVRNNANSSTGWTAVNAFNKNSVTSNGMGLTAWHFNHTGEGTIIRYYFDVNFGEATTFAGIRYYARSSTRVDSKTQETIWENAEWNAVRIYGSNDGVTWYLLKSQDIDEEGMRSGDARLANVDTLQYRQADVVFDEAATYQYARIVVENTYADAAARQISFLTADAITSNTPEAGEEQVVIKADSTVGGTVKVNGNTSSGDNVVTKDAEVTLSATASSGATFKYWIEVNTGKIITYDNSLTLSGSVGRNVRAVFAAATGERFVSFYGKDGKSVIGSGYVGKDVTPEAARIVPSELKAYVSGYSLEGWKYALEDLEAVANAVSENTTSTEFFGHYVRTEKTFTLTTYSDVTVTKTVSDVGGSIEGSETTYTVLYGTRVALKATDREGYTFSHWTYGGEVIGYEKSFSFSMPMNDIAVVPVYVEGETEVVKELNVSLTYNEVEEDLEDGTAMAGLVITRYVPTGVEVVESGIIYVRDGAYIKSELKLAKVGTTSVAPNGAKKTVSVSLSSSATSGQYKFNARYEYATGLTAVAFITYEVDGEIDTIYSSVAQIAVDNN